MSAHGPREHMETVLLRSRTFTDRRCFLQISPLPCRRSASVVSEFLPLTPFRSRSARPHPHSHAQATPPGSAPAYVMQHPRSSLPNNVGVARFFDWSEQEKEECPSVSRLYRELAVGVGASVPRTLSERVRPSHHRGMAPGAGAAAHAGAGGGGGGGGGGPAGGGGGGSPRVNPGRMFLRDKGMLTKGEREIIEGIYKNRGDLSRKDPGHALKAEYLVRSHHDAWLVGKPGLQTHGKPSTEVPREAPRGHLMEVQAPLTHTSDHSPRGGSERPHGHTGQNQGPGRTTCVLCLKEQQLLQQLQQQRHQPPPPAHHKHRKKKQHPSLPPENVLRSVHMTGRGRGGGGGGGGGGGAGGGGAGGGGGDDESSPLTPPSSPSYVAASETRSNYMDNSNPTTTTTDNHHHNNNNNDSNNNTISGTHTSNKLLFKRRVDPPSLTPRYSDSHPSVPPNTSRFDPHATHTHHHVASRTRPESDPSRVFIRRGGGGGGGGGDDRGEVSSDEESSHDSDASRRKVQVKVYLPSMGADPCEEELRASILQGRPALARGERPLTNSDLRPRLSPPQPSQPQPQPQPHPQPQPQPLSRENSHPREEEKGAAAAEDDWEERGREGGSGGVERDEGREGGSDRVERNEKNESSSGLQGRGTEEEGYGLMNNNGIVSFQNNNDTAIDENGSTGESSREMNQSRGSSRNEAARARDELAWEEDSSREKSQRLGSTTGSPRENSRDTYTDSPRGTSRESSRYTPRGTPRGTSRDATRHSLRNPTPETAIRTYKDRDTPSGGGPKRPMLHTVTVIKDDTGDALTQDE